MTATVEKLEELLARVQKNRARPRLVTASPAAASPAAAAPAARPAPAKRRAASPLEAALKAKTPSITPAKIDEPRPAAVVDAKSEPPRAAVAAPRPAPTPAPAPEVEPIHIARPAASSAPVAEARGAVTLAKPKTFSELLERTLALKPR